MPDYKTMYFKLFSAVSDAIEILNKAQLEMEELYINLPEPEVAVMKKNEGEQ